jgi:prevent-host-death family protein
MKIASVADVKAKSSEKGPVVVTKNGRPVAMLLAISDEDEIERMILAYSPKFRSLLDVAEGQIREGKGLKHEEFWQEVETEISKSEYYWFRYCRYSKAHFPESSYLVLSKKVVKNLQIPRKRLASATCRWTKSTRIAGMCCIG